MNRVAILLLTLLATPGANTQTQWVLQEYMHRIGVYANEYMGSSVSGIGDYNKDGKLDVAVSQFDRTGLWFLNTGGDTVPQLLFNGTNLTRGDLNGDGYVDYVSSRNDTVTIYWGTSAGIDTLTPTRLHGEYPYNDFGYTILIGNLFGDSLPELVICVPSFPDIRYLGKVYIYMGSNPFDTLPAYTITGDSIDYSLGWGGAIGDLNGDGYNDLAVRGEFEYGQASERWHYVDVWFGGAVFDTVRDLRMTNPFNNLSDVRIFDTNGDGKKDLIWGTQDSAMAVYIHFGGAGFSAKPDIVFHFPSFFDSFASKIIDAGDMDGDGYHDIAISDRYAFQSSGVVLIYRGGAALDTTLDAGIGQANGSMFGSSIDTVGDVNGDGRSDIIIGAPEWSFGTNQGYFGIFLGSDKIATAVDEPSKRSVPTMAHIEQNYPNPFNPSTKIRIDLPKQSHVFLKVYNLLGREVALLLDETKPAGTYQVMFNATSLPSGVYFYRLQAGDFVQKKTMVLMK